MKAHREVILENTKDLLALVRTVRETLDARTHRVTRTQVRDHAKARLQAGDEEWQRARAEEAAQAWLAKITP
jgi:hypothetical protein